MIVQGQCQHCAGIYEYEAGSKSEFCPHCGKETFCTPPKKITASDAANRQKSSMKFLPWIIVAVLVVVSGFLAVNFSREHAQRILLENKLPAAQSDAVGTNSASTKKPDYPPPPTSGMEFMAKILKNFPERMDKQHGWMDATFWKIDNLPVKELMGDDADAAAFVAFTVSDKNGDWFENCVGEKSKLGDQLIQLQDGDRIRISGEAANMEKSDTGSFDVFLRVDSIQVIK
jgi:predicted  nucleic acid-binding Zn-ribbon protein